MSAHGHAAHITADLTTVLGNGVSAFTAAAQAVRANREASNLNDWADYWARRAAAAEAQAAEAAGKAAGYRMEWIDAEDRIAVLAAENARLRSQLARA